MTNEEAIKRFMGVMGHYSPYTFVDDKKTDEAMSMALNALKAVGEIKKIINIPNFIIQEDVLKYKMICEVVERMDEVKE